MGAAPRTEQERQADSDADGLTHPCRLLAAGGSVRPGTLDAHLRGNSQWQALDDAKALLARTRHGGNRTQREPSERGRALGRHSRASTYGVAQPRKPLQLQGGFCVAR